MRKKVFDHHSKTYRKDDSVGDNDDDDGKRESEEAVSGKVVQVSKEVRAAREAHSVPTANHFRGDDGTADYRTGYHDNTDKHKRLLPVNPGPVET